MTFSIAARCVDTGMFGIAVSSSSPAVAARCAHARAGVGAFGTQNITDPRLGPQGLDLMAKGASAEQAIATLKQSAPHIEFRQLIAVDANGKAAAHSGDHTLGTHATAQALNVVAAGNLLRDEEIPAKMVAAFQRAQGHLVERLLTAMEAAIAAGGEEGPVHSAGLLVVRDVVSENAACSSSPNMGEDRGGGSEPRLSRTETRLPPPGPPPCWGRGSSVRVVHMRLPSPKAGEG
jgi:uncharacterized Ntn-hydrolase superfamily protein